ncbi:hypothetical protein ACQPW3_36325 [Actinosynnema sp. CA-248983]
MSTPMRFWHVYTPTQYELAAELWGRLLDSGRVSLQRDDYRSYLEKVTKDHLLQLIMSDGAETYDHPAVTVTLVSYCEQGWGGADIDAANVRALEDTPGVQTRIETSEGQAWVQLGELPGDLDDDVDTGLGWLKSLVETIESLNDHPFIDEDSYYKYEEERREAAWDEYIHADLLKELDEWAGEDDRWQDFGVSDDELREMYYEHYYNNGEAYWEFQGLTMVYKGHDSALKHIQNTVLAAWRAPLVDPNQTALSVMDIGVPVLVLDDAALSS